MFEVQQSKTKSSFWKFLVLGVLVFGMLVAAALYFSQVSAPKQVEVTGLLRAGDSDFDWYKKYLALREPKIQMGLNFAGNRIVMFSGVIENNGERTIDVVELKVTFFNYETVIEEMYRIPVKPGPYTPPLPPLTERVFNFYIEEIPRGWMASHSEMEICGVRFGGTELE